MWSWSISASGSKPSVLASIKAHDPDDALDDNSKLQFLKARSDAVKQVTALAENTHIAIGISGNAETFSSTITPTAMKP